MKKEGRQHGMVTTCKVLPSPFNSRLNQRVINPFDSPPTAGLFPKVQNKPTNHSKYTGKCSKPRCDECHLHPCPCAKSKHKAKGSRKLKSCDVVSNHRLITWRVVDGRPGLKFGGFSATSMLEQVVGDEESYADDYNNEYDDGSSYVGDEIQERNYCDVEILLEQVEEDER